MRYFESHAHYDDKRFQPDRDALLRSLPEHGVKYVVNSGSDLRSSRMGKQLAEKYNFLYFAAGFHPHELHEINEGALAEIRALAEHKKCVAIGEIGLDYYYDTHPRETQKFWFKQQLRLAKSLNIPVIIHSREAAQECFDIIRESKVRKGVIHCYSNSLEMARDYVNLGYYIGIGGVVTFPNAKKMVEVVEGIPLEKILIETDAPYLAPMPHRGERNDSRYLEFVVQKIAEIKGVSAEEVAEITFKNGKKLFFK